jgi:hypothetical protein
VGICLSMSRRGLGFWSWIDIGLDDVGVGSVVLYPFPLAGCLSRGDFVEVSSDKGRCGALIRQNVYNVFGLS